jgi:metallo-beta-lactamase class B
MTTKVSFSIRKGNAMMTSSKRGGYVVLLSTVLLALHAPAAVGQAGQPPDQPVVTVRGQTYTPRSILARNMGTEEDQTTAFPPHKVVANVYYVGTRTLSSYLITTPQGHILLNSTYERNVRTIEKSVTQLGFTFTDVRILLGTHAHGDHQEGDALVKELTGAQVMVMQEDVPALEAIKPGGKVHPIDRTLRDGEEVTLGGTTLVAHLTAGHTRGCTTWTMKAQEGGRTLNVVFACSYRAPATLTPAVESEFNRTFKIVRSLPCDVPLGDHPAQYNLSAKYASLNAGAPNPFVDPSGCWLEADIQEAMFRAQIQMQK